EGTGGFWRYVVFREQYSLLSNSFELDESEYLKSREDRIERLPETVDKTVYNGEISGNLSELFADEIEAISTRSGELEKKSASFQSQWKSQYENVLGKSPLPVEFLRIFGQKVSVARAKVFKATYYCEGKQRSLWLVQPLSGHDDVLSGKSFVKYEKKPSTGWFGGLQC
ncbi:MAG: hypothetical protein HY268_11360, partial [Deltaproteobacteria bacterium]|nr:hypothetical protein [Deltaproteobacteria bacterium]